MCVLSVDSPCAVNEIRSISVMAARPQGHEAEPGLITEALMILGKSLSAQESDSS